MHDGFAELRRVAEQIVGAHFGNPADLAQRFSQFVVELVFQAAAEGGDDGLARQALAIGAFDCEDEWETEFGVVVGVQFLQCGEFLRAAIVEAGLGLLAGRFDSQLAGNGGLAGQLRVGTDQAQLFFPGGLADDCLHRLLESGDVGKRPLRGGAFRDPWRMLIDAMQR